MPYDIQNNEYREKPVDSTEEQAYVVYKEVLNALNVLTTKDNIFLLDAKQLLDLSDVVNHAIKYSGE